MSGDEAMASGGAVMAREMEQQPAILRGLVERADTVADAVRAVRPTDHRGTLFLGRGSSGNAALLGRYLLELSSGRPAAMAAPSVFTRYVATIDLTGQLLVAFSQSGETPEIVTSVRRARLLGARTVAVTNDPASALAEAADALVLLGAGRELALPATKTVTAQLMVSVLIARAFARRALVDDADLAALPRAVAQTLADGAAPARLAARWSTQDRLVVAARGVGLAAAAEVALKVGETAAVLAHAVSSAEFLHGAIAAVRAGDAVLLVDIGDKTSPDLRAVAEALRLRGTDTAWCTAAGAAELPIPPGSPVTAAILVAVRAQQLAFAWALAVGLDPDRPAGLSKVTRTE